MDTSSNVPAPQSPYTILNRDNSLDGNPEDQVTGVEISTLQEDGNCLKKESQQWTSTFVARSSSVVISKNLVHQPFDEVEEGMKRVSLFTLFIEIAMVKYVMLPVCLTRVNIKMKKTHLCAF